MGYKITYFDLMALAGAVAEDNNLNTLDELFDYLEENDEHYFIVNDREE